MIRSKALLKYFALTTNNALVELLRNTKIQVCICMIVNDYNMALNVLSLSTLNSFLLKDVSDKFVCCFKSDLARLNRHLSLIYDTASHPIIALSLLRVKYIRLSNMELSVSYMHLETILRSHCATLPPDKFSL